MEPAHLTSYRHCPTQRWQPVDKPLGVASHPPQIDLPMRSTRPGNLSHCWRPGVAKSSTKVAGPRQLDANSTMSRPHLFLAALPWPMPESERAWIVLSGVDKLGLWEREGS